MEDKLYFENLLKSSSHEVKLVKDSSYCPEDSALDFIITLKNKFYFLPNETSKAFNAIDDKESFILNLNEISIHKDLDELIENVKDLQNLIASPSPVIGYYENGSIQIIHKYKEQVSLGVHFETTRELENLDALNSTLSHDIRSPFGVIKICCDYLITTADEKSLDNETLEFINKIKVQATKGLNLAESLLDVFKNTKQNKLKRTMQNLSDLTEKIADETRPLAEAEQISIVTEPGSVEAEIDEDRISQAIENLIINAIKFSSKNTTITLKTESVDGHACIKVIDQGMGIPKDKLDKIFSKYSQLDHKSAKNLGVGLGLSIAQQFVKLHDGHITVESEEGVGTTFSIHLPFNASHKVKGTNTILIIDDDEDIRDYVGAILEGQNLKFYTAKNGAEALAEFKKHQPDIVISDINMPGMDGFEVFSKIRNIRANTKFIFISGYFPKITDQKAKEIFEGQSFITKPFNDVDLLKAIEEKKQPN